ncbi:PREDICTED: protein IRX15-LIKE [Tarenaya hassleriana]|uniref:protein IRX15-LIKE n=1 Tax=Tarenaya hassleriana TaxID=28532 RepID=UPI00053C4321|nr:PREDICTED: protein IRX15-LIKE [Tarenaya hassleriana]
MKSNTNTKVIVFHHPSIASKSAAIHHHHRLWFIFFLSLFTLVFSFTLFTSSLHSSSVVSPSFPPPISAALLQYVSSASAAANSSMSLSELSAVSTAIRSLSGVDGGVNLLVFGLTHESLLWRSINFPGRTVFVDDSSYAVSKFEQTNPGVEAYDIVFSSRVSQAGELLRYYRTRHDCRPVQNLLFSDCELAINDLPNFFYDTDWDVILVDGPSGFSGESPGRMSAIFTSAVLARSKREGKNKKTDVFVHEFGRTVERVYSEEFLCEENLVEVVGELAHFSVEAEAGGGGTGSPEIIRFCRNSTRLSEPFAPVIGGEDDEDGGVNAD